MGSGLENKTVDWEAFKGSGLIILVEKGQPLNKHKVSKTDVYHTKNNNYHPKVNKRDLYPTR